VVARRPVLRDEGGGHPTGEGRGVEYARDGIRVNCVCPGTFLSGIHAGLPPEAIDAMAARHPLGLGSVDDLVGRLLVSGQ
jgi:NAD(P)-dependent dehydrogenase (short-subunit alcohol dehydrogenase family)